MKTTNITKNHGLSIKHLTIKIAVFIITPLLLMCQFSANHIKNSQDEQTPIPDVSTPSYTDNYISQYGITWYFNEEVTYGQFANGDYWVIGPVDIVGITPYSNEIAGRTKNGSMINPTPLLGATQGFDSVMYGSYGPVYSASLNAALDVSDENPLHLDAGASLISSISNDEALQIAQLRTVAILTVLSTVPPEGSFRPPYCGNDKTIEFNTSMLNYSLLSSLEPVEYTPTLSEMESAFERPWLDYVPGWMSRGMFPSENMPDYGRDIASLYGKGTLMLQLNFTEDQKRTLLIRLVQIGIDLYGVVCNGGQNNWYDSGGHGSGRKWPILFAGIMFNDSGMKAIGSDNTINFGEDMQTFYVDMEAVTMTHSSLWDPVCEDSGTTPVPYENSDIGIPEWGIRHTRYPERDHKTFTASYRQCCTATAWTGAVLSVHIMNAKSLWNHDALFDYQDRYMHIIVPQGTTVNWQRSWSAFSEKMWDEYRGSFGSIWNE